MRPTVDQLHNSGRYVLIESFAIDDMNQFLMRELGMAPSPNQQPRKLTGKSLLLMLAGGLVGGVVGYTVVSSLITLVTTGNVPTVLSQAGLALLGFVLLLPIHEFIHGLAFKRLGAPKVGYGYSLKSLIIYAYSQNFPVTMREVAFIAVMPFAIITAVLIGGWFVWPAYGIFWGIILLIHTNVCIGDFVLIGYYLKNRHRVIYTYDDIDNERRSYFFLEA